MAVDSGGVATAVWERGPVGDPPQARRIAADGTLAPTQDLFIPGDDAVPNVVVDSEGTATTVIGVGTRTHFVLKARRITADGILEPVRTLSSGAGDLSAAPQLAAVGGGATIVVWERYVGNNRFVLTARRLGRDGTLGRSREWSTGGGTLGPEVAVDGARGGAVAVWHNGRSRAGPTGTIQARGTPRTAACGPIRDMSAQGRQVYDPQVSVGATSP